MLRVSRMASQIQPSATLAAGFKARQLRAQGVEVFDFSLGEPDFVTPEHIRQAASEAMRLGRTRYTPANGLPELREAVAQSYERRYGVRYTAEQVLISNGAKHSLSNSLFALCDAGDEVIIPAPYWTSYGDIAQMTGATPVLVQTTQDAQFKMTPDQLRRAITPRSKVLMLNSPHNPTGTVYSREELVALTDVVLQHDLAIVSDEIYESLTYGDATATNVASLSPEVQERTVTVCGASKSYAMTGWRMGWALGPLHLMRAMGNVQSQQTSCPSSISQYAALAAVTGDQSCVQAMRREFAARREIVMARLAEIPGLSCARPDGAFYALIRIAPHLGRRLGGTVVNDSETFCRVVFDTLHVNFVPGSAFGAEGYVRMSFAAARDQIEGGLAKLAAFLAG
jgi:aspartate aminotransferase